MNSLQAMILGVVQGLTEFLPVSSSGHLVLAREFLGLETAENPAFEVVVHLGTLASILVVMRGVVWQVTRALPLLLQQKKWAQSFVSNQGFRLLVFLVPATIPTVFVALLLKDQIDAAFTSPQLAAAMLLVTAIVLLTTRFAKASKVGASLGLRTAFLMGVAQSIAIIPGISRSGSTIAIGIWSGSEREQVGAFSFLMAIPAILGAAILHGRNIADSSISLAALASGFVASFLTGSLALVLLLKLVKRGHLWIFSPYLLVVGGGYLVFSIIS